MKLQKLPNTVKQHFIKKPLESSLLLIAFLLAAAPIVVMLVFVVRYSVNVPWWDQISFVTLMEKVHTGTLTVANLWAQHNEHRILVPQALELAVGKVTGYNFRVPVFLNWVTTVASFGFILHMLRRTFTNTKLMALLAVVFAWLIFSPFQYVNWIWGFQLAFFLSIFFTIFTLWVVTYRNVLRSNWLLALAIVLAGITTYCNGNGLLIWPLGLAILLWRRTDLKRLAWWCGIGLVFIVSYLYKFHRSPDSPTFSMLIREPAAVIKYTLAYLGRNLALTPTVGRYVGLTLLVVLVVSTVAVYKKGKLTNIISWLALAVYVILTGLLAAISRLNFGVDHGFNSTSYPTISLLFIVATVAVTAYALVLWLKDFQKKSLPIYLTVFFIVGGLSALPLPAFFSNYADGVGNFKALSLHLKQVQSCVYTATSVNDPCLAIVFPGNETAWQSIQTLKQLHWAGFKHEQN